MQQWRLQLVTQLSALCTWLVDMIRCWLSCCIAVMIGTYCWRLTCYLATRHRARA
jgi:hypothetical protein